jgi:hypothetical protein
MDKTIASLKLARVLEIDDDGVPRWVGGDTVIVQLGDVLDRGNTEIGGRRCVCVCVCVCVSAGLPAGLCDGVWDVRGIRTLCVCV